MVSSNLQGGLGNQMFQISAAVSLALQNNDEFSFDLQKCHTPNQGKPSNFYSNNILKNVPNISNYQFTRMYWEPKFSHDEIHYQENLILNGYFQSEKYFWKNQTEIKNLFFTEQRRTSTSDVITSVHIRRGDYQKFSKFHNLLNIEYYKKAIDYVGEGKFMFFSDDILWVKENFVSDNFLYSETNDEVEDFYYMSSCDNNIIANSSFSWWAAYLNKNPNKIIISPTHENWFGPDGPKDTQDLIPQTWIQI